MIGHTLVTGASGFVGSAVARALLAEGYSVRALVRPASPRTNLDGLAVEIVEGDVRDADAVDRAMHDIRYVVHTAADYRLWAPRPDEIVRTNVDGTRIVMVSASSWFRFSALCAHASSDSALGSRAIVP